MGRPKKTLNYTAASAIKYAMTIINFLTYAMRLRTALKTRLTPTLSHNLPKWYLNTLRLSKKIPKWTVMGVLYELLIWELVADMSLNTLYRSNLLHASSGNPHPSSHPHSTSTPRTSHITRQKRFVSGCQKYCAVFPQQWEVVKAEGNYIEIWTYSTWRTVHIRSEVYSICYSFTEADDLSIQAPTIAQVWKGKRQMVGLVLIQINTEVRDRISNRCIRSREWLTHQIGRISQRDEPVHYNKTRALIHVHSS